RPLGFEPRQPQRPPAPQAGASANFATGAGSRAARNDYTKSDTPVNEDRPPGVMILPLFPLHTVLFPGMALPLHIFEARYRLMINECLSASTPFGIVLIDAGHEVGEPAVPHTIATTAHIAGAARLPDGRLNMEVVGQQR